jgi:hypothetical protein
MEQQIGAGHDGFDQRLSGRALFPARYRLPASSAAAARLHDNGLRHEDASRRNRLVQTADAGQVAEGTGRIVSVQTVSSQTHLWAARNLASVQMVGIVNTTAHSLTATPPTLLLAPLEEALTNLGIPGPPVPQDVCRPAPPDDRP